MTIFVRLRQFLLLSSFLAGLFLLSQAAAQPQAPKSGASDAQKRQAKEKETEEDKYDRLDGKGASGKTVDVIEFAGNFEIHVYPGGSTQGLSVKVDRRNKDKPVAVIAYRFNNQAPLVRRAILSIPLSDGFLSYRDTSVTEYDKFIFSNNELAGKELVKYKLDPPPKQLYPEGHPANDVQAAAVRDEREPANSPPKTPEVEQPTVDENGSLKSFSW